MKVHEIDAGFVNRRNTVAKHLQLLRVVVDANDVVAKVGKHPAKGLTPAV